MKILSKILLILILSLSLFSSFGINTTYAITSGSDTVDEFISDFFDSPDEEIPYCDGSKGKECGLNKGITEIKSIDGIETERRASEYIQDVVAYLLGFIYLAAVILIIYAGFNMLTSAGDEDKFKKSKDIIIYTIIGIIIIYLANSIVKFIINGVLTPPSTSSESFSQP